MTKIITYNVNGIRSAMSKGLMEWIKATNPDIICFQELKAEPGQLDLTIFEKAGYHREVILENMYKKPMPSRYLAGVCLFLSNYNNDSFIKELIKHCFLDFFDAQVSKYTNALQLPVNSVGSIGYYYKDLLIEAAHQKGFTIGNIIKSPIEGLIKFHS